MGPDTGQRNGQLFMYTDCGKEEIRVHCFYSIEPQVVTAGDRVLAFKQKPLNRKRFVRVLRRNFGMSKKQAKAIAWKAQQAGNPYWKALIEYEFSTMREGWEVELQCVMV